MLLIASVSLINSIHQEYQIKDVFIFPLTLYTISILFLIFKKMTVLSLVLFVMGIMVTALNEDINNFSGSILFVLSFIAFNNKLFSIPILIATILSLSVKAVKFDIQFSFAFNLILAYIIIYILFYFIVYRQIEKLLVKIKDLEKQLSKALKGEIEPIRNIDVIDISQEEKAILHLFCRGYDYNKIQKTLGLNIAPNSVRRKITAIKKENKNKILSGKSKDTNINDAQFGKWLYQKV